MIVINVVNIYPIITGKHNPTTSGKHRPAIDTCDERRSDARPVQRHYWLAQHRFDIRTYTGMSDIFDNGAAIFELRVGPSPDVAIGRWFISLILNIICMFLFFYTIQLRAVRFPIG
jgi:hypothetical protein